MTPFLTSLSIFLATLTKPYCGILQVIIYLIYFSFYLYHFNYILSILYFILLFLPSSFLFVSKYATDISLTMFSVTVYFTYFTFPPHIFLQKPKPFFPGTEYNLTDVTELESTPGVEVVAFAEALRDIRWVAPRYGMWELYLESTSNYSLSVTANSTLAWLGEFCILDPSPPHPHYRPAEGRPLTSG